MDPLPDTYDKKLLGLKTSPTPATEDHTPNRKMKYETMSPVVYKKNNAVSVHDHPHEYNKHVAHPNQPYVEPPKTEHEQRLYEGHNLMNEELNDLYEGQQRMKKTLNNLIQKYKKLEKTTNSYKRYGGANKKTLKGKKKKLTKKHKNK